MNGIAVKNKKYQRLAVLIIVTFALAITMRNNLLAESVDNQNSKAVINFKEGNGDVDPLNPEDPNYPGNGGTDSSGPLVLNHVSSLLFDEQEISPFIEEYLSITQTPYIQITDVRGTGEGWEVNALATNFINKNTGAESLKGANITFTDASCINNTKFMDPPTPKDPVVLKTDRTLVNIAKAGKLSGMGTWLIRWYTDPEAETNSSVKLTVPGGSGMEGENSATITWLLMNVPID